MYCNQFKTTQTASLAALLCTLQACTSSPRFTNQQPIELAYGKKQQHTITVKNISDKHQLYLVPGGPYVSSEHDLNNTPNAITLLDERDNILVVATNAAELLFFDTSYSPAKLLTDINLHDSAIALFANKNMLYIGYEKFGLEIFDITNLQKIKSLRYDESLKKVSRIASSNGKIFILQNQETVLHLDAQSTKQQHSKMQTTATFRPGKHINDFIIVDEHIFLTGPEIGVAQYRLEQPDTPAWWFTLQEPGKRLTLYDNFLYVAAGKMGLIIFELQPNMAPRWTGSHNKFDSIDQVMVNSNHAVIVDQGIRLSTLNINDKTLPITGSFYKPTQPIFAAALDEKNAYIATANQIQKITFPHQSHAQISNEGINQGGTRRAYIDNNIAYVADWFSGLHLYDISNPKRPVHLSNFHTPGSSKGVVVENGIAYVGDDDHGLQIIDVSDPAKPAKISEIMTTGLAYTLKKYDNRIYLADHRGGLHIIDVSNVYNPVMLGSYDTAGKSWAIEIKGNYAYVADDNSGVLILDISDPKNIAQVGQFNPGGFAEDIYIQDNTAFVSFFDKGLYILDITQAQKPVEVSQLAIPGNARSITIVNQHAYIAGWESGLQIVDITDLHSPRIVGHYDTKGSAWGVDVYKDHAYIWDWWGGVKVIDVSIPEKPQFAGKYHTRGEIRTIRNKGNYLYTASGAGGVQVFDINNALNPIWVTGYDSDKPVTDIWLSDKNNHAYVASDTPDILVLDISDPFYIRDVKRIQTGSNTEKLRERNNILAVVDRKQGIKLYDIHDLDNVTLSEQLTITVNDLSFSDDNKLFLAANNGFYILTLDSKGRISDRQFYEMPGPVNRIAVIKDTVVTVMDRISFNVWQWKKQRLTPVATRPISAKTVGLDITQTQFYLTTQEDGLLVYDMVMPEDPRLVARYPATNKLGEIVANGKFVFFAGTDTIASVDLLPAVTVKYDGNDNISLRFPADLALGNYHLELGNRDQSRQLWPGAVSVVRPKNGKSQISMEKFKQLLQQQRASQNNLSPNNPQE